MAQYVIVYVGGNQPSTPEEGKQHLGGKNVSYG